MGRMNEGKETWHRLLEWDRGQASAERLSAIILHSEGYKDIDPSHPLGGKDGRKDIALSFNGIKYISGVFFPRGQQSFDEIKKKFLYDIDGVKKNNASGFVFITNQELRLAERAALCGVNSSIDIQIFHLERISSLLNAPKNYGIRMEFLDIEMTKEEQLAFFSSHDEKMAKIENKIEELSIGLENFKAINENYDWDESFSRTLEEVSEMANEFCEKVWFDRHMLLKHHIKNKKGKVNPEIWEGALAEEKKMIEKYGEGNLGPYSSFEWGMLNGKLSALRWIMGAEWDMLDT